MPADTETLHYSDTHCSVGSDDRETLYTDDPRDQGINCSRCLSEMAADPVGTARQVARLQRAVF